MKVSPLSNHGNQTVNIVIEEDETKFVCLVKDVKPLWLSISLSMQKHNTLTGVHGNCKVCKTEPGRCEELKDCIQ